MKRKFVINGISKEAPEYLKETPQINSKVSYCYRLYLVSDIVYYMAEKEVYIYLEEAIP